MQDFSKYSFEELCEKKQKKEIDISWDTIDKIFDLKPDQARQKWKRIRKTNGELSGLHQKNKNKILIVSDFHFPFNFEKEIFKNYCGKVDTLIFNGDIQDCFSISKFVKKYRVPFIEELIGTRLFLIELINYIKPKEVIFNYGNHEARLLNALDNKLSDEFMALMPNSSLGLICDTGFWAYNHKNKSKTFYESLNNVFKNNININYTDNWYCRVQNMIVAHPKAFRSGILKTSEQAYLWFLQNGEQLFDCLVLSHTHHQGIARYGKTFLYETGCLCKEMDYNNANLTKPQEAGFLFIIQEDGKFIYDESKMICL